MTGDAWFHKPQPRTRAGMRLFCLPYAGGGPQMFMQWPTSLPSHIELSAVCLPGRWKRFTEPAFTSMSALADALAQAFASQLDRPFVLFGHSMGALLGYEVVRRLQRARRPMPVHFYAAGCAAPHLPDPHPIHHLPDEEFLTELRRYAGMPDEILNNPDLLELLMPVLRADATVTETYVHENGPPLTCPLTAIGGEDDRMVTRMHVEAWKQHTTNAFALHMTRGDHFFVAKAQDSFLPWLADELDRAQVKVTYFSGA